MPEARGRYRTAPKAAKVVVRCLGPGEEHTFRSGDPTSERVCKGCREKLKTLSATAREKSVRSPE